MVTIVSIHINHNLKVPPLVIYYIHFEVLRFSWEELISVGIEPELVWLVLVFWLKLVQTGDTTKTYSKQGSALVSKPFILVFFLLFSIF